MMQFLAGYALATDIGARYEYLNFGGGLLGTLLARRAGMNYDTLLETRITGPLGMQSTRVVLTPDMQKRLAAGHNARLDPAANWNFPPGTSALAGAGGLRSTAADLLTFLEANLGTTKSPLAAAMNAQLATRRPTGIPGLESTLGWHVLKHPGGSEIVWHNGVRAATAPSWGSTQAGPGVVVLSNSFTNAGVDDIRLHLLNPAAPLYTPPPPRTETTVDPKLFDGYAGRYQLGPNFILTVTREDTHLFAQATGQGRFELYPESARVYFAKSPTSSSRSTRTTRAGPRRWCCSSREARLSPGVLTENGTRCKRPR